jgi:hypothetical protein
VSDGTYTGPWSVHAWGDNDFEINAADHTVCNVPGFDDDTVDQVRAEYNARLIAAAPEMLDALKASYSAIAYMMSNDDCGGAANALEAVVAAIAIAEGGAS